MHIGIKTILLRHIMIFFICLIHQGDVEKRIRHYNYLAWPDMGTPKTSNNMITFVDTIRREVKPTTNGPIIVHCRYLFVKIFQF